MMLCRKLAWIGASTVVVVSGCSGGSSGSALSSPAGQTSKAGEAVFTYFGQPKPLLTTSSNTVTVVGQAGATFSTITLDPPPNLADTYLVFSRQAVKIDQLYTLPYNGTTQQMLYASTNAAFAAGVSGYGAIAFSDNNNNTFTIRPDGTGLKALSWTGVSDLYNPQFSLDGTNRAAFFSYSNHTLYVGPGTGGSATVVQSNLTTTGYWNPSGTELLSNGLTGTSDNEDVYLTSPSGGAVTDVTPTAFVNQGLEFADGISPDGVTGIGTFDANGSGVGEIVTFSLTNPTAYNQVTVGGDADAAPCFSPDGSKIAFYRTNANGATAGIYLMDASGDNQQLWLADGNLGPIFEAAMHWSPFLPKETVVAATASTFYHQASSGFLLSLNGSQFGSFVAFTANTPADAAIQPPSSSYGSAPLVFTVTADSITEFGYINDYFNPGTTITLTGTPSVVVAIDGTNGKVSFVAPAATPKAAPSKNPDGTLTYTAQFRAVYDGKGKNLAPNGANQLTVNPKTGKLIAFK